MLSIHHDDDKPSNLGVPKAPTVDRTTRPPSPHVMPPPPSQGEETIPLAGGEQEDDAMERQTLLKQLDLLRISTPSHTPCGVPTKYKQSIIPEGIEQQVTPVVRLVVIRVLPHRHGTLPLERNLIQLKRARNVAMDPILATGTRLILVSIGPLLVFFFCCAGVQEREREKYIIWLKICYP